MIGTKIDEVDEKRIEEVRRKVKESTKGFAFINKAYEVDLKHDGQSNTTNFIEIIQTDVDKATETFQSHPNKDHLGSFSISRSTFLYRNRKGCC